MATEAQVRELAARKGLSEEQTNRILAGESVSEVLAGGVGADFSREAPPVEQFIEPVMPGEPPAPWRLPYMEYTRLLATDPREAERFRSRGLVDVPPGMVLHPPGRRREPPEPDPVIPKLQARIDELEAQIAKLRGEQAFEEAPEPEPEPKVALRGSQGPKTRNQELPRCAGCGEPFEPKRSDQRYHHSNCRKLASKRRGR